MDIAYGHDTFDLIDRRALMRTVRSQTLSYEYVTLLSFLYTNQKAILNRSSQFLIQR